MYMYLPLENCIITIPINAFGYLYLVRYKSHFFSSVLKMVLLENSLVVIVAILD